MKADISDAPERVTRARHKSSVFYAAICLAVGSIVTIGALQLLNRTLGIDSESQRSMSSDGEEGQLVSTGKMPLRQDLDASWIRAPSDITPPTDTARQTVFNDRNFIPRGADNVVNFGVASDPSPPKERPKKLKLTIVQQPASAKDRGCWPYKQGSIESRNCRASIGLKYRD